MRKESEALIRASRHLLDAHDYQETIEQLLHSARELLGAEAASVFLVNGRPRKLQMAASTNLSREAAWKIRFPMGQGVAGWVAQNGSTANIHDISRDSRFYNKVDQKTGFRTRGYLCVPLVASGKVIGTLQVLNRNRGDRFTRGDQELLEGFAVLAALSLVKSRMHEDALARQRMESELEVARAYQQRMLPETFPDTGPYQIAATYHAARNLGGDLYDAFPTPRGYQLVLGDVSGKGPGAALWMASLANLLRYQNAQGSDPLEEFARVDEYYHQAFPSGTFITLFMGLLADGRLRYLSAGHNPMLLVGPEGGAKWLEATGVPLGVMPGLPRETREVSFPPGSRLVLFSDGVTEAENIEGGMYEEQRLWEVVRRHSEADPAELCKRIVRSVKRFSRGTEQADDITVLVAGHPNRS